MSCWVNMEGHFGWSEMSLVEEEWRKGPWTVDEDKLLNEYVRLHGEGRWNSVARLTGLKRNGKSCRLRWVNYLRPDLKRGQITPHEETIILDLHARWGNRWSTIAKSLPGRTDNEIKNYWRTHFKNKTKTPPPCTPHEKIKARLLKKQQFQQQQQQIQHLTQLDIKNMMFLLDETTTENTCRIPYMATTAAAEMATAESHTSDRVSRTDDPTTSSCYSTFILNNGNTFNNSSNMVEDTLWDGSLWNLEDDFHGSNSSYAWSGLQQLQIHS